MTKEWEELRAEARLCARALLLPLAVMWAVAIPNLLSGGQLNACGVVPRAPIGLVGILFAPLLHVSIGHLLGNTISWLIAGGLLVLSDARRFLAVTAIAWITSGAGIWLTGETGSHHVGASGVIFGFYGYVLARGWVTKSALRIGASISFGLTFGVGIFVGLLPQGEVSWEGHLFGLVGGIVAALIVGRSSNRP